MSYPPQAPWSGIGSLQSEISEIKFLLSNKGDKYELGSTIHRLDNLEHTVREISSLLDGFRYRIEALEENKIKTHIGTSPIHNV